jgi:aryl-alcohol dehydrogenase-like predicted oxidoreductase
MKTLPLPGFAIAPSQLCFGTNMFGTAQDHDAAQELLETFFGGGGNFLDTAHSYGDWVPGVERAASERLLGDLLASRPRDSYLLATKGCEFDYRAGDFALRVTPALMEQDLGESLENLKMHYVDLYWLHRDDPSRPAAEIVDALIAAQASGRIRLFGCSNWTATRIAEAQAHAASRGHTGFAASQPMWGLAEPDRNVIAGYAPGAYYDDGHQAVHAAGITQIPYSGQSRGYFSKLAAGKTGEAMGADIANVYDHDINRRKLPVLQTLAARHGCDVNAVVLAYLCSQPLPTIPIIGASSAAQLRDSMAATRIRLDATELRQLHDA